jgi:hypothetical protein
VVFAEAADESGVGEDAAPALANEGSTGERRRFWREAEEDILEEVFVIQRRNVAAHLNVDRAEARRMC